MADEGTSQTFMLLDERIRYRPGDIVRIERPAGRVSLIHDSRGTHEVMRCTPSRTSELYVQVQRIWT
jgi:hypothetical protein